MPERYGLGEFAQDMGRSIEQARAGSEKFHAQPNYQKGIMRATRGVWLLLYCGLVGYWFIRIYGHTLDTAPKGIWYVIGGWGVLVVIGVLSLWIGLRSSRGPHDIMSAFKWAVVAAIAAALWWYKAYFDATSNQFWLVLVNLNLWCFYIASFAASLVRIWLVVRGPPRMKAAKLVKEQKAHGDADFVPEDDLATQMSGKNRRT